MDFSFLGDDRAPWVAAAATATLLLIGLGWMWARRRPAPSGSSRTLDAVDTIIGWPPEATRLLTHRHRRAYGLLRQAMPEHMVFAQVPVSRFISVPTRLSYAEWLRRVGHVCVDLLVCDHASNIVAVIEVRESGRSLSDRARKRQRRLERLLRAVGVPLQVWDEAWLPDPVMVRKTLLPDADEPVDLGAATVPMDERYEHAFPSGSEPPRTTWFDEAHGTRPTQLDDATPRPMPHLGGRAAPHPHPQSALLRR